MSSTKQMGKVQRITPFLWFDREAEHAARFYAAIFENSRIVHIARYSNNPAECEGHEPGSAMTVKFVLDGTEFIAMNGGPMVKFNPSISFVVLCENEEEIDHYWDNLCSGGDENSQRCGWIKDQFGLSWQVVPRELTSLLTDDMRGKRVMDEMLTMKKLDIRRLRHVFHEQDEPGTPPRPSRKTKKIDP